MNSYIQLEDISIKFRIYNNPTPSLKESFLGLLKNSIRSPLGNYREFEALKDINLLIQSGEKLGIIGANGAGKSTLLKIISGIYPPTTGRMEIFGNITPMMELGAGFDIEQTGRENIYLNGAILGYPPQKMAELEQQIIDFSGIEDFIDTPVKYYSSGMYVRLAFSIAAITYPEILILDEILAAGDAEFSKKAFNRIAEFIDVAQIVILVSHQLDRVAEICNRVIVLDVGKVVGDGDPVEMIELYQNIAQRAKK